MDEGGGGTSEIRKVCKVCKVRKVRVLGALAAFSEAVAHDTKRKPLIFHQGGKEDMFTDLAKLHGAATSRPA